MPKRFENLRSQRSNLTFLCGGLFVFGPNFAHFCLTAMLLAASWIGSVFLLLPQLRGFVAWTEWALVTQTIPLILLVTGEVLLFLAATVEPGYLLPNNKVGEAEHRENSHLFRAQYCTTCRVLKPPRTRHCRICNHCVQGVDHHCPWLGICVGQRNYFLFFSFVCVVALSAAYNLAASVIALLSWAQSGATNSPLLRAVSGVGGLMWFGLSFSLVTSLLCFHIFLCCRGQTTVEYLKEAHNNLSTKMLSSSTSGRLLSTLQPSSRGDEQSKAFLLRPSCSSSRHSSSSSSAPGRDAGQGRLQQRNEPSSASAALTSGSCCGVPAYGCCPPPSRFLPLWKEAQEGDDEAEDDRREALMRQLEDAIMQQLEDGSFSASDGASASGPTIEMTVAAAAARNINSPKLPPSSIKSVKVEPKPRSSSSSSSSSSSLSSSSRSSSVKSPKTPKPSSSSSSLSALLSPQSTAGPLSPRPSHCAPSSGSGLPVMRA